MRSTPCKHGFLPRHYCLNGCDDDGETDMVNHPPHYKQLPNIEVIEITEHLNFCLGNVVKYVLRADHKGKPVEDLKKARFYLDREIARRAGAIE